MSPSHTSETHPRILGLLEKRIEGDDSLMELARLRLQEAGLGAEMYAGTPEQLEWSLNFRPSPQAPVTVHLAREFNLMEVQSRTQIEEFAVRFAGQVYGLVLHDHAELALHPGSFVEAARDLQRRLEPIQQCPWVFVEYASGLNPAAFACFFGAIRSQSRVSACIDIGHVGIRAAQRAYAKLHPGEDVCALKTQPERLPGLIADVEASARTALPTVRQIIGEIGDLGKPVHFHLHDGHPLSTFSPFGVSDHLSFLTEIPIGFEHEGKRSLPLMYGPKGLERIIADALTVIGLEKASFTLEIHPSSGGLPLGDAAPLFNHWTDKTNAERMNHWLDVLRRNRELVRHFL